MPQGERQVGRKESLFREVNEEVRVLAAPAVAPGQQIGFVCECSDEACTERLQVPVSVYEEVRAHERRFLVAPGHEGPYEHVVARGEGYVIVEKEGEAARVAAENDPRG